MVKFGEEGVDQCKPNVNAIYGAVVCKRNHVDIFCRLNTMHERHLSGMSMLIDKWSHGEVVNCILCCMLITYTVLIISSTSSTQLVSAVLLLNTDSNQLIASVFTVHRFSVSVRFI